MNKIRLLAMDLDGTILTNDKRLTERTAQAIRRAAEAGIVAVPVTGRPLSGLPREVAAIPGIRYAVSSNGGVTTDLRSGKRLREACIDRAAAAEIVRLPMERGLIHSAFLGGLGYCEPAFFRLQWERFRGSPQESYVRRSRRVALDLPAWIGQAPDGVENIWILVRCREEREELDRIVRARWNVKTVSPGALDLEIASPDAGKGLALLALARSLGIGREEILAIGDHENDLEMLEAAGVAVAMGNAPPDVKRIAAIVADTNENDGAAKVIEQLF